MQGSEDVEGKRESNVQHRREGIMEKCCRQRPVNTFLGEQYIYV